MVAPGAACHTVTSTIASQARFSLARMLVANGVTPNRSARTGSVFENR